ncbi:MAG: VWA domain-containing protein [Chloroflexi bacterium]|nr:VWA domain-containing protein [Chloroflexota bacterium]MCI0576773.1 VWA domain-containing protein [Chloroflexota bacterium]MCI0645965.1 VWA domain-containing protein [Chloroflexota bacterium]MCI0731477.1 VWA domain-containing protein [Chloroflexota bacterium]
MAEEMLKINVQASRNSIAALEVAQLLYLLVDIRPPGETTDMTGLPLNLCLVIDRSTSMNGERLDKVKAASALIIDRLGANDIISVVAFSDRADVVLPASRVHNKTTLLAHVKSIMASGGTEIYQGLQAGIQEIYKAPLEKRTNQLILLTDGHTYGDAESCLSLAQRTAGEGVEFSAFGIGSDWNDHFLDRLVAPSGGQSAYIETPSQVIDYLQRRIQGMGAVYAQNLRLVHDFPVGVRLKSGFKVAPYAQPLAMESNSYKLGSLEAQSPLSVLLEFNIEPQLPGRKIHLPLNLTTDIPSRQLRNYAQEHGYELSVVVEDPVFDPPPSLLDAVQALNFYRMNEQVWEDVEAGNVDLATKRMRRLTTRLLEAGHTNLAQQAYTETERLATMGSLSLEGRKRLKYGTRSLITQTIKLD